MRRLFVEQKSRFLATDQPSIDRRLCQPLGTSQWGISDVWMTFEMVVVFGAFLFFFRVPHHYAQPPLRPTSLPTSVIGSSLSTSARVEVARSRSP
jgi:hypothetical protein